MVSTVDFTTSLSYLTAHAATLQARSDSPNQNLLPLTADVSATDHLVIGGCDVPQLMAQFGSPLYILDEETLRVACRQYRDAMNRYYPGDSLVIYASKAWNCLAVCAIVHSEQLGIDVVSAGELLTAVKAGVPSDRLYFHGNNKSREELQQGIDVGCRIVVDNWFELKSLVSLLKGTDKSVSILLRITPGIECHTHEYIRTGHLDSKFGFDPDQMEAVFEYLVEQPNLHCIGLHAHIGSQIFELQPHADLGLVMVQWLKKAAAYGLPVSELDIGGGLGICYTEADDPPSIDTWVKTVAESIVKACEGENVPLPRIIAEPGRSLIGSACVTAYTVGSQKTVPGIRTYVAVDGGMSDNPRPITYQSVYRALVANRMSAPLSEKTTLAGKHCESGDVIIQEAYLPALTANDVIVVAGTGAYNYSMASNYNRVPRPAAVLVNGGEANLIIRRETAEDLLRYDCLPVSLMAENTALEA